MKKALFILTALLMVAGLVALALPTGTQATTDNGIYIESVNPQDIPGYYMVQYELLDGSITLRLANASVNSTETQSLPSASMTLYISNTISPDGCDYRIVFIDHSKFSAGTVHFGNFSGLLPGNMNLVLNLAEDAQGKLYVEGNCSNVSVSSETTKGGSPDETVYTIGGAANHPAGAAIIGTDSDTAKFGGYYTIGGGTQTYLPLYSIVTTKHSKNHVNSAGTLLNDATLEGDGVHFYQSEPGYITDYVGTQGTLVLTGAALDLFGNNIEYQFKISMRIGKVSVTPTPTATTPKYNLTVNQASSCCNVSVAGHANASGPVVAGSSHTFYYIPQNTVLTVIATYNGSCNTWNNWTGGVGNASAMSTNVTMSSDKTITAGCANESVFYNLKVDQNSSCCNVSVAGHVNASGTVSAGSSNTFYYIPQNTLLTVIATYNGSCNAWNNWSGLVTNASNPSTTVNMTISKTIVANCANVSSFNLTVNQTGKCCNVTVSGSGVTTTTVSAGSSRNVSAPPGTVVNVSAVYTGTCNTWNNWIGDPVDNASAMSTMITMVNGNKSITANCTYVAATTPSYNLTVNQNSSCCNVTVSGSGITTTTVNAGSSRTFDSILQNTVLTLRAVFNGSCNYFSGWTGSVASASAMNTTVNMTSTRTITAGCTNESLYRLTVNQSGSCCNVTVTGHGTVATGTSNGWDIIAGTIVNVSAAYNGSCNHWNNWTGGVLNASAMSTAVNMSANRTITAGCTYVAPVTPPVTPKYSLTVNQISSCCNVSVSGHANASGTVIAGTTTTFSNIPSGTVIRVNASYNGSCDTWGNWSSSVANISAMNTTVTMSANRSITADCTYTGGQTPGGGGGAPSWLWPVVGVMIFLTLVLFGYAANRAGWIGKPKGWFGGGMEEYTADGFGEEDVYDKLYGETGGIEKGTGGGSDMHDDEL